MIEALILFLVLAIAEPLYIRLARRCRIGGMHCDGCGSEPVFVPVGGGVIFIVAATAAALAKPVPDMDFYMAVAGGVLLASVSYIDDIVHLSPRLRLVVQTIVMAAIFYTLPVNGHYTAYLIAVIGCVGYINASNFMDGSNGMLAGYSAVVLVSLAVAAGGVDVPPYTLIKLPPPYCVREVSLALLMAVAVFAFYNFRRRALVFSGDVGSITLGFFIAVGLTSLIIYSGDVSMAILVVVFLIDTFCTFMQRLLNGEKVLQAHRKHLYQLLIRRGFPQTDVATAYAAVQLAVSAAWFATPEDYRDLYSLIAALVLLTVYMWIKRSVSREKSETEV